MLLMLVCGWSSCYFSSAELPSTAIVSVNATDPLISQRSDQIWYRDSLLNGSVYALYENGDTAYHFSYKHGKQHGWQHKWYPNGSQMEVRYYEAGKKEGTHVGWWENGKKRFRYEFSNDEHNGELLEWYSTGTMMRKFHHKNGHEDGRQQYWWENGTFRSNYDVIDGKRFGLIGNKLCKNSIP